MYCENTSACTLFHMKKSRFSEKVKHRKFVYCAVLIRQTLMYSHLRLEAVKQTDPNEFRSMVQQNGQSFCININAIYIRTFN